MHHLIGPDSAAAGVRHGLRAPSSRRCVWRSTRRSSCAWTSPTTSSSGRYWPERTPRRWPTERGAWRGADHSLFLRSSQLRHLSLSSRRWTTALEKIDRRVRVDSGGSQRTQPGARSHRSARRLLRMLKRTERAVGPVHSVMSAFDPDASQVPPAIAQEIHAARPIFFPSPSRSGTIHLDQSLGIPAASPNVEAIPSKMYCS